MATINYSDRSTSYASQRGVTIKTIREDYKPGAPETLYVTGPDHPEYVPCKIDSFGNVCDDSGIVLYPSGSGLHPRRKGDRGYFGEFSENYAAGERPDLPSIENA